MSHLAHRLALLSLVLAPALLTSLAHAQLVRAPSVVQPSAAELSPEVLPEAGAEVLLELTVGVDGRASDVAVVTGVSAEIDAAAVAAMGRFVFTPAETSEGPVAVRLQYRFVIPPPPPRFGSLAGVVRDARTGAPVSGVQIRAIRPGQSGNAEATSSEQSSNGGDASRVNPEEGRAGASDSRTSASTSIGSDPVAGASSAASAPGASDGSVAETTTDTEGRFELARLAPGPIVLELSASFGQLRVDEVVVAGERLEVVYDVVVPEPEPEGGGDPDEIEIVVFAPPEPRAVVAQRLTAQQAREVPGTGGDVVRVVESLPGVARSGLGSGRLVVWGASPDDTRVFLDGVPIPRLFHEGGVRSVVPPSLVDSVELVPGGAGPQYGRGLGGVVAITTREPEREGLSGGLALDTFDASASLGYRGRRGSIAAEARLGLVDRLVGLVTDDDFGDLAPIPRYGNGMLRGELRLDGGRRVAFGVISAGDRYSRGVGNPDPAQVSREERELDFTRAYATYVRDRGDGTETRATPWVGFDRRLERLSVGATDASTRQRSRSFGLRSSHRARVKEWLDVAVGLDLEVVSAQVRRVGTLASPPREGDERAFGQPLPDERVEDAHRVWNLGVAPWAELSLALWEQRLRITPGLRIDPTVRSVSRRTPVDGNTPEVGGYTERFSVEPRLSVSLEATPWLTLRAAGGRYQQPPSAPDVSSVFGNPTLDPSRGWQALGGAAVSIFERLSIEATGFVTASDGLAVRSTDEAPLLARALENEGEGRARGVQAIVRYQEPSEEGASRLFGWVAYTFSRAERKDAPGEGWRRFDFDQTHVLTAVAGWSSSFGLELSARFRYATGFPRTPVYGASYDASRDRYEPVFGPQNAARLPAFNQLDLRVAQGFDVGDTKLTVYLEVLNVTNRSNVEEIAYAPDWLRRGEIEGLPIFPVLGLRWDL